MATNPDTAIEPGLDAGDLERRHGPMERLIDTLAGGLGDGIGRLAESGVLFVLFLGLWLAFAAAVIWSQGSLDAVWQWIRDLPLLVEAVVWLLFLPIVAGLWIWETTWPLLLRVVLVAGIAGWNLLVFLPRALQAPRP
jgi:hypothetical protein